MKAKRVNSLNSTLCMALYFEKFCWRPFSTIHNTRHGWPANIIPIHYMRLGWPYDFFNIQTVKKRNLFHLWYNNKGQGSCTHMQIFSKKLVHKGDDGLHNVYFSITYTGVYFCDKNINIWHELFRGWGRMRTGQILIYLLDLELELN